jgi:hypothetical protein
VPSKSPKGGYLLYNQHSGALVDDAFVGRSLNLLAFEGIGERLMEYALRFTNRYAGSLRPGGLLSQRMATVNHVNAEAAPHFKSH